MRLNEAVCMQLYVSVCACIRATSIGVCEAEGDSLPGYI